MSDEVIRIRADIDEIKQALTRVEEQFTGLEGTAGKTGRKIEESQRKGKGGVEATTKAAKEQGQTFDQVGKQVERLGKRLLAAYSVTAVIRNVTRIVTSFENANANLNATLGTTAEQTENLRKQQLALGSSTKFTAAQVADAQLELGKLGQTLSQITKTTPAVLDLAAAVGVDLATAAKVVSETLNQFGLDASAATDVVDVMAKSFTTSALDLTKFQEAMKFVGPTAKAAGVSLRETTAMMAMLANAGISGSNAGTALRRILSDMARTGKPAAEALRELGERGLSLSDAYDEVGRSAQSALLVLTSNTDALKDMNGALQDVAGTAQTMADKQLQTLTAKITIMQSAWEGLVLSIENGEGAISKAAKSIVENITGVLGDLTLMNEITAATNASFVSFFFDFDNSTLKAAKSIKIWADSAREAMAANNWSGARADIDALKEMASKYKENSTEAQFLAYHISELEREYNRMLVAIIAVGAEPTKALESAGVKAKGLVEQLKEQLKTTDELIEKAGSQASIDALIEKRIALEEKLNQVLNKRKDELEEIKRLDEAMIGVQKFINQAQLEQQGIYLDNSQVRKDILADEIMEMQKADLQRRDNEKAFAAWQLEFQRANAEAQFQIVSNYLQAIAVLAQDDAVAYKALASFQAVVDTFAAINSVLASPTILDPFTKIALATSIGALGFANVVRINTTPVPSFYEGTPWLQRGSNKPGKDTIPVMAHEGEAIIPTKRNQEAPGLAKAWIQGNLEQWIRREHIEPALRLKEKEVAELQQAALAQAMGTMPIFSDDRIVSELRRNRRVNEDVAYLIEKSQSRRNPYRA